jgi:hypothetical protein
VGYGTPGDPLSLRLDAVLADLGLMSELRPAAEQPGLLLRGDLDEHTRALQLRDDVVRAALAGAVKGPVTLLNTEPKLCDRPTMRDELLAWGEEAG